MTFFQRCMQAAERLVLGALAVLMATCLAIIIVVVSYQVISRQTNLLPFWPATEELARGFLIWMVFLGASYEVQTGEHFAVKLPFQERSPWAEGVRLIQLLSVAAVGALYVVYGWDLMQSGFRRHSLATGWPAAWTYASVFVCGVAVSFFCVGKLIERRTPVGGVN